MNRALIGIVLLVIGIVLAFFGINASESVSSEMSEAFQGAPSNKAIFLLAAGVIVGVIGLVQLVRGRRAP
jgi:uncharacterized membrane protein YidH (DUF202 family)